MLERHADKKTLMIAGLPTNRVLLVEHTGVDGMDFGLEEIANEKIPNDGTSGGPLYLQTLYIVQHSI